MKTFSPKPSNLKPSNRLPLHPLYPSLRLPPSYSLKPGVRDKLTSCTAVEVVEETLQVTEAELYGLSVKEGQNQKEGDGFGAINPRPWGWRVYTYA